MVSGKEQIMDCFDISSDFQDWKICGESRDNLNDFRQSLLLKIVVSGGYTQLSSVVTPKDP